MCVVWLLAGYLVCRIGYVYIIYNYSQVWGHVPTHTIMMASTFDGNATFHPRERLEFRPSLLMARFG